MPQTKVQGKTTGRQPYTPPVRTLEDDRYLLNWLSTRTDDDSFLVRNRRAYAQALGLTVEPGRSIAPGELKHTPVQLHYEDFLRQRKKQKAA